MRRMFIIIHTEDGFQSKDAGVLQSAESASLAPTPQQEFPPLVLSEDSILQKRKRLDDDEDATLRLASARGALVLKAREGASLSLPLVRFRCQLARTLTSRLFQRNHTSALRVLGRTARRPRCRAFPFLRLLSLRPSRMHRGVHPC